MGRKRELQRGTPRDLRSSKQDENGTKRIGGQCLTLLTYSLLKAVSPHSFQHLAISSFPGNSRVVTLSPGHTHPQKSRPREAHWWSLTPTQGEDPRPRPMGRLWEKGPLPSSLPRPEAGHTAPRHRWKVCQALLARLQALSRPWDLPCLLLAGL